MVQHEVEKLFSAQPSLPHEIQSREVLRRTLRDAVRTVRCHCKPGELTDMIVWKIAEAWLLAEKNLSCVAAKAEEPGAGAS